MKNWKRIILISCFVVLLSVVVCFDIIVGKVKEMDWGHFSFVIYGLIFLFLLYWEILVKHARVPEEQYLVLLGLTAGWGSCVVMNWLENQRDFNSDTIVNIVVLLFLAVLMIAEKRKIK